MCSGFLAMLQGWFQVVIFSGWGSLICFHGWTCGGIANLCEFIKKVRFCCFTCFKFPAFVLLHECVHRCGKFVISCSVLSTSAVRNFMQASGREIWTLVVWMYIICLVHFLDYQWWFDPLCLGADLILSVLLALGCPCGHLQLQDVASPLIFGPSPLFACKWKLDLKFCTIYELLACLLLWCQFTEIKQTGWL